MDDFPESRSARESRHVGGCYRQKSQNRHNQLGRTPLYTDDYKTILEKGLTNTNENVLHATLSIAYTFFFIEYLRLYGLIGLFAMTKTNTLTWLIVIYDSELSTFNCKEEFMRYDPDKVNGAIDKNRAHTMDSKYIYDDLRHHVKEYLSLD